MLEEENYLGNASVRAVRSLCRRYYALSPLTFLVLLGAVCTCLESIVARGLGWLCFAVAPALVSHRVLLPPFFAWFVLRESEVVRACGAERRSKGVGVVVVPLREAPWRADSQRL